VPTVSTPGSYLPGKIPYSPGQNSAAPTVDYNSSNTNKNAFDHAVTINITSAIKATSWGLYQVMGSNAPGAKSEVVKNALNGNLAAGNAFLRAFYSDPVTISDELLVAWFENNPVALAAAQQDPPDFTAFATQYNGPGCCGPGSKNYDKKIEQAYYEYKEAGYDDYDAPKTEEEMAAATLQAQLDALGMPK